MARPTRVHINQTALLHNVTRVRQLAPGRTIIAMVKANAYGCGLAAVVPVLEGHVEAFGVACTEEASVIRQLGSRTACILFQGIFSAEELHTVHALNLECVIHQPQQLTWILQTPLPRPLKVHVKVNTGMNRLGFAPQQVAAILDALRQCPWINPDIGLMTHLASADQPHNPSNQQQLAQFCALPMHTQYRCSAANSAAIFALQDAHFDVVRPGLMLYGVSPFADQTAHDLGLAPVMHLMSAVTVIHHYPPHAPIGYGGSWQSERATVIGVVPIGYGDGYPRHIAANTPVMVNGMQVPIVGRVSMDMLTIDLSQCQTVQIGDPVELWGSNILVETIAHAAGTLPYELICQLSARVRF